MSEQSKAWVRVAVLTFAPLLAILPLARLAGSGVTSFATVWPILLYAPLAMWMESQSITVLLATCRGRRDPLLMLAVPLGVAALGTYTIFAALFACTLPGLLRLLFS